MVRFEDTVALFAKWNWVQTLWRPCGRIFRCRRSLTHASHSSVKRNKHLTTLLNPPLIAQRRTKALNRHLPAHNQQQPRLQWQEKERLWCHQQTLERLFMASTTATRWHSSSFQQNLVHLTIVCDCQNPTSPQQVVQQWSNSSSSLYSLSMQQQKISMYSQNRFVTKINFNMAACNSTSIMICLFKCLTGISQLSWTDVPAWKHAESCHGGAQLGTGCSTSSVHNQAVSVSASWSKKQRGSSTSKVRDGLMNAIRVLGFLEADQEGLFTCEDLYHLSVRVLWLARVMKHDVVNARNGQDPMVQLLLVETAQLISSGTRQFKNQQHPIRLWHREIHPSAIFIPSDGAVRCKR